MEYNVNFDYEIIKAKHSVFLEMLLHKNLDRRNNFFTTVRLYCLNVCKLYNLLNVRIHQLQTSNWHIWSHRKYTIHFANTFQLLAILGTRISCMSIYETDIYGRQSITYFPLRLPLSANISSFAIYDVRNDITLS